MKTRRERKGEEGEKEGRKGKKDSFNTGVRKEICGNGRGKMGMEGRDRK